MSLIVLMASIVLILGTVYFLLDMRQSSETQTIYRYLLADARRRAMKKFSVIIILDKKAETIIPLLSRLQTTRYKKLEVIVVLKRSASKKAEQLLKDFNSVFGKEKLNLKFVSFARGVDTTVIARQYATGDYLLELDASDRLSKRFFEIVSQTLAVKQYDFLAVRVMVRPNKTFANAFWATTLLLRATIDAALGQGMPLSRVLVRRKTLTHEKQPEEFSLHFAVAQTYIEALGERATQKSLSWGSLITAFIFGVLFTAGYFALWYFIDHASAELYTSIAFVTLELMALLFVIQARGYTILDALNFVLFIPLAPLFALGEILRRAVISMRYVFR